MRPLPTASLRLEFSFLIALPFQNVEEALVSRPLSRVYRILRNHEMEFLQFHPYSLLQAVSLLRRTFYLFFERLIFSIGPVRGNLRLNKNLVKIWLPFIFLLTLFFILIKYHQNLNLLSRTSPHRQNALDNVRDILSLNTLGRQGQNSLRLDQCFYQHIS